jgi:hypothetical protein
MMRVVARGPSALTTARARRAVQTPLGAAMFLDSSIVHLDLPQAVFDAMLEEFERQQAARGSPLRQEFSGRPTASAD